MHKRREGLEVMINGKEKVVRPQKFVRLKEGAAMYSIGLHTFRDLARDAGAIYHIRKIVLVNTEILDEFLEAFRDETEL